MPHFCHLSPGSGFYLVRRFAGEKTDAQSPSGPSTVTQIIKGNSVYVYFQPGVFFFFFLACLPAPSLANWKWQEKFPRNLEKVSFSSS